MPPAHRHCRFHIRRVDGNDGADRYLAVIRRIGGIEGPAALVKPYGAANGPLQIGGEGEGVAVPGGRWHNLGRQAGEVPYFPPADDVEPAATLKSWTMARRSIVTAQKLSFFHSLAVGI